MAYYPALGSLNQRNNYDQFNSNNNANSIGIMKEKTNSFQQVRDDALSKIDKQPIEFEPAEPNIYSTFVDVMADVVESMISGGDR